MHALALAALVFGLGLGAYSEPSFLPLYLAILVIFAFLIFRADRRYLVILFVSPLLAFGSLNLYYGSGVPGQVRIDDVKGHRVTAIHFGRRYLVEGLQGDVSPGKILQGEFHLEGMTVNRDGFRGKLTVTNHTISADFLSGIKEFKERLFHQLISLYGHDKGSLIGSLVLGYRTELFQDRKGSMRALGILHILSISGFHIALLEDALRRMRLRKGAVIAIFLYGVLVDSVSSSRAVLMCLYRAAGSALHRDPDPVTGLAASFFLQALMRPYLVFHFGFLLTYLSTLGIILLGKRARRRFAHLPDALAAPLSMTASALLFSMPFLILLEGGLSIGVFVGNLVMVPLYTLITYLSFVVVIFMGLEPVTALLHPFVEAFFDLSLHLGGALSGMSLKLHLLPLLGLYPALLAMAGHCLRKNRLKTLFLMFLLCLFYVLPVVDSLEVVNWSGRRMVRVTSAFRTYEIMDGRLNEKDYLPLERPMDFSLGGSEVSIARAYGKRDRPTISINGKRLKVEPGLGYDIGMSIEQRILFFKGKVIKVR